ncbi:hypothetical protein HK098_004592 [Nowakowskiella sp. JEL0407]|nr:hypothetical protein HK098_004592 [Nowakowskiella sp. JEL0407]
MRFNVFLHLCILYPLSIFTHYTCTYPNAFLDACDIDSIQTNVIGQFNFLKTIFTSSQPQLRILRGPIPSAKVQDGEQIMPKNRQSYKRYKFEKNRRLGAEDIDGERLRKSNKRKYIPNSKAKIPKLGINPKNKEFNFAPKFERREDAQIDVNVDTNNGEPPSVFDHSNSDDSGESVVSGTRKYKAFHNALPTMHTDFQPEPTESLTKLNQEADEKDNGERTMVEKEKNKLRRRSFHFHAEFPKLHGNFERRSIEDPEKVWLRQNMGGSLDDVALNRGKRSVKFQSKLKLVSKSKYQHGLDPR